MTSERAQPVQALVLVGGQGHVSATHLRHPKADAADRWAADHRSHPRLARPLRRRQRAVLSLGYRPEPFIEAFPSGSVGGVELAYAVEPEPLDTAGAIRFAGSRRISCTSGSSS